MFNTLRRFLAIFPVCVLFCTNTYAAVQNDFDGDGKGDILYRGETDLSWRLDLITGNSVKDSISIDEMSSCCGWLYNGSGDFDNDGKTDVIIRNVTSGKWYIYNLNGGDVTSRGYVPIEDAVVVGVQAVADFNNDGFDDVLLRNEVTGEWTMALLQNRSILQELKPAMSKVLTWSIVDARDFDGNGSADILIRNESSGAWYLYLYDDTDIIDRGYITSILPSDVQEEVQGIGDFDGDGNSDILIRNTTSLEWSIAFMDGKTPRELQGIQLPDSYVWEFNAIDDFDGDGKSDISIKNAQSEIVQLLLWDTSSAISEESLGSNFPTDKKAQTLITVTKPVVTNINECVRNESVFDSHILPILTNNCANCHSETPRFGAPYSLMDYETLVAGEPGTTRADRSLNALINETMPPAGQPSLSHGDLEALTSWLSCGLTHVDHSDEVTASKPVFSPTKPAPADATIAELTTEGFAVPVHFIDHYEEFEFKNIVEEDMFINRIEGIIDESRVVHHITLSFDNNSTAPQYLYAWAPGTEAVQFPDGGLRLKPNDTLTIEMHYNNGAGVENVLDSSGIRLYLNEVGGTEYGMLDISTWDIVVPPGATTSSVAHCAASEDYTILAGMPHMHETGSEFTQEVLRVDGSLEELFSLSGWSFNYQPFYEMSADIKQGDVMRTTCTFENNTDKMVTGGLGTKDEMCFNFLYVTPVTAGGSCD